MRWTEEKISKLNVEEYNKYRKEIIIFYSKTKPNKKIKIQNYHKNYRHQRKKTNKLRARVGTYLSFEFNKKICQVFYDIKTRCFNKKAQNYKYYGGRGIKCNISKNELIMLWFRDYAYLLKKPSIDRIDNDGNYEYSNCRFIEMSKNTIKMLDNKQLT